METHKINSVLNSILLEKYFEILKRKQRGLFFRPFWNRIPIDVKAYFEKEKFIIIAEIKRASPLKGDFTPYFDPLRLARLYEKGGAKAISVITEEIFFRGSLEYLAGVRVITDLPILRKDFILDPIQIEEAKAFGADFVLLIASILNKEELAELIVYTKKLGLSCLVEVHDEEDLEKTVSLNPDLIGINNRNLKTLTIDITTSLNLSKRVPKDIPVIAESGYQNPEEIKELVKLGFKGVLIGTSLVREPHPDKKLRKFVEVVHEI